MLSKFSVLGNCILRNNGLFMSSRFLHSHNRSIRHVYKIYARCIHINFRCHQNKQQYEYDPATDSFRPKSQSSFTHTTPSKQSPFISFLRRWTRTVFMITGGIVWGALLFVATFVDMKETSEFSLLLHDIDDEARMLVFYNLAHSRDELSRIVSMYHNNRSGHHELKIEDFHDSMHKKRDILMNTIDSLKSNDHVKEILGEPVQICGYRVSDKIGELIQIFQKLAIEQPDKVEQYLLRTKSDEDVDNKWDVECFLEGYKGIASLTVSFKRKDVDSEWKVQNLNLQMMEKAGRNYSSDELNFHFNF